MVSLSFFSPPVYDKFIPSNYILVIQLRGGTTMKNCPRINQRKIQLLSVKDSFEKIPKEDKKRLNSAKEFKVKGNTITNSSGKITSALAKWKERLCIDDGFQQARYIILDVYLHGKRYRYAIPIQKVASCPELPELDLSKDELKFLYKFAEELSTTKSRKEKEISVERQEQLDVKYQCSLASHLNNDELVVAHFLETQYWILSVLTESLLVNLRPWIPTPLLPTHVTAFATSSQGSSEKVLFQLLGACNLTTSHVPIIKLQNKKDLEKWAGHGCRMALLKPESSIRDMIFKVTQSLILANNGDTQPYVGQVFLKTTKKFTDSNIYHISIPSEPPLFTDEELDAFRSFMAKVMAEPEILAERVITDYYDRRCSEIAYRIKPVDLWHSVIESIIAEGLQELCDAVKLAKKKQKADEEKLEQQLDEAVKLLLNPNLYLDGISREWAKDEVGVRESLEEFFALYKKTKNGSEFLAFTKDSLARLCYKKIEQENYPLVIERLKSSDILENETTPTKLGNGNTIRLVRIDTEFLQSFTVSEVTPHKEDTTNES